MSGDVKALTMPKVCDLGARSIYEINSDRLDQVVEAVNGTAVSRCAGA
jgi:hypothetical protein